MTEIEAILVFLLLALARLGLPLAILLAAGWAGGKLRELFGQI